MWELKYQGTRDGFKSTDFHKKCDGIRNTLTVVKTMNGNIFGGHAEKPWHSSLRYVSDPNAYVFSLVNKENRPFKVSCSNDGRFAMYSKSQYGPVFGSDGEYLRDIVILSDSNANEESYSNFGYAYKHPEYEPESEKAKSILAGSRHFQTAEIEVFAKKG